MTPSGQSPLTYHRFHIPEDPFNAVNYCISYVVVSTRTLREKKAGVKFLNNLYKYSCKLNINITVVDKRKSKYVKFLQ